VSGTKLRFTWDGDTYEMPEAEAAGVLKELSARGVNLEATVVPEAPEAAPSGIQYSTSGSALADWNADKPDMDLTQDPEAIAGGTSPDRDWIDELADGLSSAGQGIKNVFFGSGSQEPAPENKYARPLTAAELEAGGAGAVHGATMGTARLLPGEIGEQYRAWDDEQRTARPEDYAGGDLLGGVVSPANLLIPGGAVASTAGKTALQTAKAAGAKIAGDYAKNVAVAGLEGTVRSYSDANPEDRNLWSAVGDGATDATGAALLAAPGAYARHARDVLPVKADLNRVAATGAYGSQMKRMAQNKGEDYVTHLGRAIEEHGLHKADPSKSRLNPVNWIPQGADTYANNAADLEKRALEGMKKSEDAIATLSASPAVHTTDIINDQRAKAAQTRRAWDPAGDAESQFRSQFADRIEAGSTQALPVNAGQTASPLHYADWNDALEQRRYLDENIDWNKLGGYKGAGMEEQARREVAGDLRSELNSALDRGVSHGTVPRQLANDWKGSRDDYALAAAVRDPSVARVFQEYGNQKISLPAFAFAGAAGDPTGMAAQLGIAQAIKHRGAGALADWQRGQSNVLSPIANGLDTLKSFAPASATRAPVGAAVPTFNSRPEPEDKARMRDAGRGHMLADNVLRMVTENPAAMGSYIAAFNEAESPSDVEKIAELLARQNDDFRERIYPQLIGGAR